MCFFFHDGVVDRDRGNTFKRWLWRCGLVIACQARLPAASAALARSGAWRRRLSMQASARTMKMPEFQISTRIQIGLGGRRVRLFREGLDF